MIELNINKYTELIKYLGSDQYTIEPFIHNCIIETITIDPSLFIDTQIQVLKSNDNYYNLYCIKVKGKELNGIDEYQCYILSCKIFNMINKSNYHIINRKLLTQNNFDNIKNTHDSVIIKSIKQKYYENNLYWDWFKINF